MNTAAAPVAHPLAAWADLFDTCAKCQGSGVFKAYGEWPSGKCFACNGLGRNIPAPEVQSAGLRDAFARAQAAGLKKPRITLGGMAISLAPATGANAGALYVKAGMAYLGKVKDGKFFRSSECSDEQETRVLALMASPLEEAMAEGKRTGVCCLCARELTDPNSIAIGVGPVCAERWGM